MTAAQRPGRPRSQAEHALGNGTKRARAKALVERLWPSGEGVLSLQVLQELFVTLTRKLSPPVSRADARDMVSDLTTWQVVQSAGQDVLETIDATTTWQIAFWDAMLVTAARKAGAAVLWSEDLNDGQAFGGTVVRNPFRCERSAGATAAPRRGSRRSSTPGPPGPASRSKRPT
jgi:predicted nucleic acid-binding protein